MTLAQWVFLALLHFAPVEQIPTFEGFEETAEEARDRYLALSDAIAAAAEEDVRPTGLGQRDEAALLVAIAIGETRLSRDTDVGPCFRGRAGGPYWSRCDHGRAASVWQLHRWDFEGRRPQLTELFADRGLAARMALHAATTSLWRCRALPAVDRLSALSGRCVVGLEQARGHYRRWIRIRAWRAP